MSTEKQFPLFRFVTQKALRSVIFLTVILVNYSIYSQNLLNVYKIRSSNVPFDSMYMVKDIKKNVKILESTSNIRTIEDSLDVNDVFIIFDLLNTEKNHLTYKGRKYIITSCKLVSLYPFDTVLNSNSVKRRYYLVMGLKAKRRFSNKIYNLNSKELAVDYHLFSDSFKLYSNNSKKEVKSFQNFLRITFYSNINCDTVYLPIN